MIKRILTIPLAVMGGMLLIVFFRSCNQIQNGVQHLYHSMITGEETTYATPTLLEDMREIGEWEFLSVTDEEIVDTAVVERNKLLAPKQELIRIYYGTLRFGIDMRELTPDSFEEMGDSLFITLPPIRLLEERFIDEARTISFYETDKIWSSTTREALYKKAVHKMKVRCLTEENFQKAYESAVENVTQVLKIMGIEKVRVQ